jgi:hypothetical protein
VNFQAFGFLHGRPETLGLVQAGHARFRRVPEPVCAEGKHIVQLREAIRIIAFAMLWICVRHLYTSFACLTHMHNRGVPRQAFLLQRFRCRSGRIPG